MIKTLGRVAALSLIATTLTVGGTTLAAHAAVPGCVSTSTWSNFPWQYADAYNGCGSTQRFYFRWDRAVDGGCNSYGPGGYRWEGRAYQARFAGLSSC